MRQLLNQTVGFQSATFHFKQINPPMNVRLLLISAGLWLGLLWPSLSQAQMEIPSFSFTTLDGNTFTQAQLDTDKPVFVMMFDPYCEHCEAQAKYIAAEAEKFREKEVQFIWVTLEPDPEAIARFRDTHFEDTGLIPQMTFLMDSNVMFEEYFGYTMDPVNIYCFSPETGKQKYFGEEQEAAALLKYL